MGVASAVALLHDRLSGLMDGSGYDVVPAGAAGLRFSEFLGSGRAFGQAGCGMAAMLAKTATTAAAHGHDSGIRNRRRRALWVRRAGTWRNR